MAYVLYLHFPPTCVTTASLYLSKKAALGRVAELNADSGAKGFKWRLMDFSARGGWCDGNTTQSLEALSPKPINYGGENWS